MEWDGMGKEGGWETVKGSGTERVKGDGTGRGMVILTCMKKVMYLFIVHCTCRLHLRN